MNQKKKKKKRIFIRPTYIAKTEEWGQERFNRYRFMRPHTPASSLVVCTCAQSTISYNTMTSSTKRGGAVLINIAEFQITPNWQKKKKKKKRVRCRPEGRSRLPAAYKSYTQTRRHIYRVVLWQWHTNCKKTLVLFLQIYLISSKVIH